MASRVCFTIDNYGFLLIIRLCSIHRKFMETRAREEKCFLQLYNCAVEAPVL